MHTHSTGAMPFYMGILAEKKAELDRALNKLHEQFAPDDVVLFASGEIVVAKIYLPVGDRNESDEAERTLLNFVRSLSPNRY